jgi:Tfp pilus assembly protein PilP
MKKSQARALAALAVALALAACHHNDDDDRNGTTTPPVAETPPPVSTVDAFFSYVMQLVSTQDETSEPGSVEGVAVTAPENTEPQPLPAS